MSTTIDTRNLGVFTGATLSGNGLDLLAGWLLALDGVVDKLRSGALVADVGSGYGSATIAMAQAFPRSAFTGYDADGDAVGTARELARREITGGRNGRNVRFEVSEPGDIPLYAFDLVTTFGGLAHLHDPLAAARRVCLAMVDDGTWMIVVAESELPRLAVILETAGFTRVRVAAAAAGGIVVEARA